MEEEMEDLVGDCYLETGEIDEDYEFDACQFYDFTRPELDFEIEEAENWFEYAGDYPPSPFIVKLDLEKIVSVEAVPKSSKAKPKNNTKSTSSNSDTDSKHAPSTSKKNEKGKSNLMLQDTAKSKIKPIDKVYQPKSSTLLKPTASHLAKHSKVHDNHSSHICTRFQKISAKLDQKRLQLPIGFDELATKRQKLEIGYLRKVAQLRHQFFLMHKSSKKVTIPREPELETQLRAQSRSSKNNNSASSETEKQKEKGCNFKAYPLNKKGPSLLQPKKTTRQLPEVQVFHLKTMERAKHRASAKVYPSGADSDAIQDTKQKSTSSTEPRSSIDDKILESPPVEQLSELSLGSDMKTNGTSQLDKHHASAKGLKKDARDSSRAELRRFHAKPNQCGGHIRAHQAKPWSDITGTTSIC